MPVAMRRTWGGRGVTTSDVVDLISTLGGLLTLAFAVYVFLHARNLLRPFERPVLSLLEGEPKTNKAGTIGYALTIKNTGQRPATTIQFRRRLAPEHALAQWHDLPEWAPANDYPPDSELRLMCWPPTTLTATTFMHVVARYADALSGKSYESHFWVVLHAADGHEVGGMDRQQRTSAEQAWVFSQRAD
jgi:hypothetical protein